MTLSSAGRAAVLLDVDNTLLDNDRVQQDLGDRIEQELGADARKRYWAHYEALREELGYADYLGALRRLVAKTNDAGRLETLTAFLLEYPFDHRLYPRTLEVIAYLREWALPVIVSDGDKAYQPRKIRRSGLWDAVEGRVLIYVHKEHMQDEIDRLYPAPRHAMVDDKLRILAAMKSHRGERITTVFVRQGHYAHDREANAALPPADLSLERIGDLLTCDLPSVLASHQPLPGGA
jgi:FMN phosphatase YigB (HAD superfamily)